MSVLLGLAMPVLTLTAFQVQLLLIVVFLAFAIGWAIFVEPYLAARTGPERSTKQGGDLE